MLIQIVFFENYIKQAATNRRRSLINEVTCMGVRRGLPLKLMEVFPIKQRNCETSSLKANEDVTNYVCIFSALWDHFFQAFLETAPFQRQFQREELS